MKSESKSLKKNVIIKNASLECTLTQNEKIKETVKQAASELTTVNEVLKQEKGVEVPVQLIKEVITQNKEVEHKVAKSADDLHQVNAELAQEIWLIGYPRHSRLTGKFFPYESASVLPFIPQMEKRLRYFLKMPILQCTMPREQRSEL